MVTVSYLSFIIKAVAAERVAECGGLLPIYSELHSLSSGSKKRRKQPILANIGMGCWNDHIAAIPCM